MTISSAFQNALSGLVAAGRSSDVIASNISNASTPGYARRSVELAATSSNFIGGVTVTGIARNNDPALTFARRDAQAELGYATAANGFFSRLELAIGTPDNPRALTNLIADFDARLLEAASRPDANERLEAVTAAATSITEALQKTSDEITVMRSEADSAIDAQVTRLNSALKEVEYLNARIALTTVSGEDDSALLDMRQNIIDEINEIVPVREMKRSSGGVALYSLGGVTLIDGSATEIEFTNTRIVMPQATFAGGGLSGLSIDGRTLRTSAVNNDIEGGSLAAQFAIRDEIGVNALEQIDAAARDLIERFQDPAVDPTLGLGDAGLFTDDGAAFLPADEVGLAGRIQVNAAVDPAQGGEVWRLRDGIGAAAPGAVGQAAQLNSLRSALSAVRVPASGDFGTGAIGYSDLASSLIGSVGVQRLNSDQNLSFASAAFFEMSQAERANGVDTDAELQKLILVEQAYGANARMIQVLEEMLDTLLRIG